jgi:peptidoglycan hydrolase CwlO-like protein
MDIKYATTDSIDNIIKEAIEETKSKKDSTVNNVENQLKNVTLVATFDHFKNTIENIFSKSNSENINQDGFAELLTSLQNAIMETKAHLNKF